MRTSRAAGSRTRTTCSQSMRTTAIRQPEKSADQIVSSDTQSGAKTFKTV